MLPAARVRMAVAPSTVMLFSSLRLPFMLKPPLVRSEKPKLLKLPPITPGFRPTTPIGLRPLNESCSMSFDSIVLRSDVSVCRMGVSAVTVTDSVSAPASRTKSMVTEAAASSVTSGRTDFLKPCSSVLMLYLPAVRLANVKNPLASVTPVEVTCVCRLVTVTVAPGTTPPCASFTVPEIAVRSNWAAAGLAIRAKHSSRRTDRI